AVVTAITIVPNVEFSLIQGKPPMLVSVVPIDEPFITDIGRSLLMPDLTVALKGTHPKTGAVEPFVTDENVTVGSLTWTPRQPGQGLLTVILPLVALGVFGVAYLTLVMIRRLKRASEELSNREQHAQHEAKHDQLSGLPNRRHFIEELQDKLDAL